MRVVAAILLTGALAGCATMSPDECRLADWRSLGYADGAEGYDGDRLNDRIKACARANVAPDQSLYQLGRTDGLRVYCTAQRGWQEGLSGETYRNVCPADLDAQFRPAYQDGRRAYAALSALNAVESAISSLRSERTDLERKISANETGLIASKTDEERERHRNELIRLRERRVSVDGDLRAKEGELVWRAAEVARLRGELRGWGIW